MNDDDDGDNHEDETASMHLAFLLLDTLPYLTLPDLHMSFDSYDDASFRLQCQLIRYLSLGQLRVRLNKSIWIRSCSLCTSTCSSRDVTLKEMREVIYITR